MAHFNRPKTTIGMKFDPSQWGLGKGVEKTRPGVYKLMVQQPLDPEGEFPFTAWYLADGRLYRVEGQVAYGQPLDEALYWELEKHWWRHDPADGLPTFIDDEDGSGLPF